jgi:hypothetical protein
MAVVGGKLRVCRLMAHRVTSLLYSNLVAFGNKRTSRYSAGTTERV